jgi:(2Fe-2S) ferredoxin
VTGDGTMTAKATCLGPCALAPVVQLFPEGTWYGGVTEAAVDRIVEEHLLGGRIVDAFAYQPTGRKQRLRPAISSNPKGD